MKLRIRWSRPLRDDGAPPEAAGEAGIIGKLMFSACGASDPGCVRANNEDYFLVAPLLGLYLVADGMGGAQAGEHASKLAAETVAEMLRNAAGVMDEGRLVAAFEEANRRVKAAAAADADLEGMGTTMVAAVERGDDVLVASVGDSRCYTFTAGRLELITQDQTWVNEVGRRLGLDEESLKSHPMRHVLTMAIGVSEQLRVNTYALHPEPGSTILLCSDGLHSVAPEDLIRQTLAEKGACQQRCQKLIALARERGGPDNITVVLLDRTS
jgi:serine/threonine protein phosphatase PrpC